MNPEHEKVLVDTSAWILGFRTGGDPEAREFLKQKIAADQVTTSPLILLELIQGCRTEKERDRLRLQLESLEMLDIEAPIWERAYGLAFDLRRKDLTIPTLDLLITALALENHCVLLHFDRHFLMIAQYVKDLNHMTMGAL